MMAGFNIRATTVEDSELIHDFIFKMARYEKLEHEVDMTVASIRESIFEKHQAEVVIGELDGKPVGFALFFHNYSTFKGCRGLYIEDIFVEAEFRGSGYGKALFLHLANLAIERGCRRMDWVVLDWNKPSIKFYESLGAQLLNDWVLCRLDEAGLNKLVNK